MTETPATTAKLSLLQWSVFSPQQDQPSAWQSWALTGSLKENGPCQAVPPQIPAMLRRRLSPMGKAALWTANEILSRTDPPFATIYCSQHGEVERTVGLLREIAAGRPLSPTAFSLSVHNASVGIHSIASQITHNITALSAGPDSLCAALLEAYSLLAAGDSSGSVLCIFCDDPLPEPYTTGAAEPAAFQAVSLLVGLTPQSGSQTLEFTLSENHSRPATPRPADSLLSFLLNPGARQLELAVERRLWQWNKACTD